MVGLHGHLECYRLARLLVRHVPDRQSVSLTSGGRALDGGNPTPHTKQHSIKLQIQWPESFRKHPVVLDHSFWLEFILRPIDTRTTERLPGAVRFLHCYYHYYYLFHKIKYI